MGWWSRLVRRAPEYRDTVTLPPYVWPSQLGRSCADVTVSTPESALQAIAVRSAVDLLASLVSELPVHVYSGSGSDRRPRATPAYLADPAGDGTGVEDWVYQLMVSWLLRGNAYGDVLDVSPSGIVRQAVWHHPDDVSGWLDDGEVVWTVAGQRVPEGRMLHRRVNPMPGRVLGLSPIQLHAGQVGLSLMAGEFGRQWFSDGAHPTGVLTNSETQLTPEQATETKRRWLASIRGSREPMVMGKGWEFKPIQVNAEESQFLATLGYSASECCRIFGPGIAEILGYESGGSMTYSNVESRSVHLLVYTANRWIRRCERLLTAMLPAPQYVRIDRDALLQSTTLDRYRAHQIALAGAPWREVNEVRDDEDTPPVPWGGAPTTTTPAPEAP